jgi:hypothetical protein
MTIKELKNQNNSLVSKTTTYTSAIHLDEFEAKEREILEFCQNGSHVVNSELFKIYSQGQSIMMIDETRRKLK